MIVKSRLQEEDEVTRKMWKVKVEEKMKFFNKCKKVKK